MTGSGRAGLWGGGSRLHWGLLLAAAVLTVVLANAHFVYVAVTSQPDCVPHQKQGEAKSGAAAFSAAKSAC